MQSGNGTYSSYGLERAKAVGREDTLAIQHDEAVLFSRLIWNSKLRHGDYFLGHAIVSSSSIRRCVVVCSVTPSGRRLSVS